ncbi:MAG: efflux RND transporter periplasmic adaptor subunit [Rhodospirillales bacterium CG15_BIG_FIL_POST_REV_8_21_14_020_66_15]|nr:MAG: efflux RND transporter periplasmic adaptor subunit [Rhodospirillales bacterium CG15_BIG_FIL_POST_REV_8_21_14_020_66_15]
MALASLRTPAQAQDAVPVVVDRVVAEASHQNVPVLGRFVARQAGPVAARISGPVAEFKVEVGDRVARGDVLAVLVKDSLKWERELKAAELNRFQAALETAQETLKLRRQELSRLEGLRKSSAFSQARLDDKMQEVAVAKAQLAVARGQLESAKASLKLAEINLFNADVIAPYGGVVSRRHTEAGAFVNLGAPLINLINDTDLEIEADVPARNVGGLTPGVRVPAALSATKTFTAAVRAVVPDENPQTRTRTVRFLPRDLPDDAAIAANQSVTLSIPATRSEKVVTVHKDAVLNRLGKTIVFLNQDGKALVRPVRLGDAVGSRLIVEGGLAVGDLVVVRGNERLRPGQAISFDPPPESNASGVKAPAAEVPSATKPKT